MRFDKIFLDKMRSIIRFYEELIQEYQVEYLHKYRVHLRKIHAYNEIFFQDIYQIKANSLSKLLKKVIKPSSLLRDLDLFIIEIDSFDVSFETKERLREIFQQQREILLNEIKSDAYKKNLYELSEIFSIDPLFQSDFDEKKSYEILVTMSENLFGAFILLTKETALKDLHKLRIKFKKFRYALELYEEQFYDKSRQMSTMLDLKELQDLFGIMQDNEVRKTLLESFGNEIDTDEKAILVSSFEINIANAREKLMQLKKECDV